MTTVHDWAHAAARAAIDVATTALACSSVESVPGSSEAPKVPFGAYVPLMTPASQLQIGVFAEWSDWELMARALFGMQAGAAFAAESDVTDALGEIANMVAGGTKRRMSDRVPNLCLGLPLCVSGPVEPRAGAAFAGSVLLCGEARASIIVFLSETAEGMSARLRRSRRIASIG